MKRIASLDILRGFSMLALVMFHTIEKTIQSGVVSNIFSLPPFQFIVFGIVFYLASWRGLFLLISGAANIYSYEMSLRKGTNAGKLLKDKLLGSVMLLFWGAVVQMFFNPYSGINDWIVSGEFTWVGAANGLLWSDALETIAVCIFISAVFHAILGIVKKTHRFRVKIIIYALFALGILFTYNLILEGLDSRWGITPSNLRSVFSHDNFWDYFRGFFLAIFIGKQQPVLPYLGVYFIGNIIGLCLASSKIHENKKQFSLLAAISGVLLVIIGFLIWIIRDDMYFSGDFIIPPDWFLIVNTGLQILFVLGFLHIFDFSVHAEKRIRKTKILRKAGLISLTIFSLQFLDLIPRAILTWVSKTDYLNRGNLNMMQAFFCGFIVVLFWIGLLLLWYKVKFVGTVDYFYIVLKRGLNRNKTNYRDPLKVTEIIENAQPFLVGKEINEIVKE